jgi:multimeric flavodoxin WrbA
MNVLGSVGGPHPTGNTGLLVKAVLEGAQSSGYVTTLFNLAELDVGHLTAKDHKITYPKDDMEKLYPHIESMVALVIGNPIYHEAWDSRTITFLNRLYVYSEAQKGRFPKGAKVVNVLHMGGIRSEPTIKCVTGLREWKNI